MSEPKYRMRLVLEENDGWGWACLTERTLYDPAPQCKRAIQAFDDVMKTLDAKETADGLRESDY